MQRGPTGYQLPIPSAGGEAARAFVPNELPPHPALAIDDALRAELDDALVAIGRLDSVTELLPEPMLFLYSYVRKEAVLSSQIEGTQATLADLLLHEVTAAPGAPSEDVREVSGYVRALEHGMKRLRGGAMPIGNRLLRELHALLLQKGRGSEKLPGEFRRSQNWVGGTRPGNALFVPPPAEIVPECMGALEKFVNDRPTRTPPLVKAALAHVQLETIHPFLDGNGRIGRLLITLLLAASGLLHEPLLYLSVYLKRHKRTYYDLLQAVRTAGEWEEWLAFFARGVRETADGAVATAKKLAKLAAEDRGRIESLGRGSASTLRVHHWLLRRPILSIKALVEVSGLTTPTVTSALQRLADPKLAVVRELTGKRYGKVYGYTRILRILSADES